MAETLNKRIRAELAKEARENAKRYWANKIARQSDARNRAAEPPTPPVMMDEPKHSSLLRM